MALAGRGLFAILPFAALLLAVLGFLRAGAVFGWLAERESMGLRVCCSRS